jgi:hypothetical protein
MKPAVAYDRDESEKLLFDLQLANFLAIGKTQKNLLIVLMSYLGLIWVYAARSSGEINIQLLGVSLRAGGFWPVAPAALTVLCLAFVGAMNAAAPAWRALEKTSKALNLHLEFYDFDIQKSLLDYLTFLTLRPELHLEKRNPERRFSFSHFLYPSILVGTLYTTYYSMRELPRRPVWVLYVSACIVVQVAFSLRIYWLAICRFLRIRLHIIS